MKITTVEEDPEDRPCPHCGEPLEWTDMFGIKWCEEMYFGRKCSPRDSDS